MFYVVVFSSRSPANITATRLRTGELEQCDFTAADWECPNIFAG